MTETDTPIYHYDGSKNPDQASLPGIPLRDLFETDLASLSEQSIRSLEATGWWTAAEEPPAAVEDTAEPPAERIRAFENTDRG